MDERVSVLLAGLGIDEASFARHLEWTLQENLVSDLARDPDVQAVLDEPDGLRRFRDLLRRATGRRWSPHDYEAIFERIRADRGGHVRRPVRYEDLLRLFAEEPRMCKQCGRRPPEVILHIDHIVPVSRGGASRRENLQFLCAQHNLQKSNKREMSPWLDLA